MAKELLDLAKRLEPVVRTLRAAVPSCAPGGAAAARAAADAAGELAAGAGRIETARNIATQLGEDGLHVFLGMVHLPIDWRIAQQLLGQAAKLAEEPAPPDLVTEAFCSLWARYQEAVRIGFEFSGAPGMEKLRLSANRELAVVLEMLCRPPWDEAGKTMTVLFAGSFAVAVAAGCPSIKVLAQHHEMLFDRDTWLEEAKRINLRYLIKEHMGQRGGSGPEKDPSREKKCGTPAGKPPYSGAESELKRYEPALHELARREYDLYVEGDSVRIGPVELYKGGVKVHDGTTVDLPDNLRKVLASIDKGEPLGQYLKKRREGIRRNGKELSLRQVAADVGIADTHLRKYETGELLPPADRIVALSRVLAGSESPDDVAAELRLRVAYAALERWQGSPLVDDLTPLCVRYAHVGRAGSPRAEFARWLKKQRKAKGITQADLAVATGLKYRHIGNLENAATSPSFETFIKLSAYLTSP